MGGADTVTLDKHAYASGIVCVLSLAMWGVMRCHWPCGVS